MNPEGKRIITRTVLMLSMVSLFTDVASEMLYPVMPIYLKSIGFGVVFIGILEGIAEAIAGLSKGYFGNLSDSSGKRLPFVRWGYLLSAISKPMFAVFIYPLWIFFARTLDRLGKGIRTGARDAMLSDEATRETKGRVFGFHRSLDTFGAVLGPLTALIFLYFYPGEFQTLFLIAFAPGLLAILITFLIRDNKSQLPDSSQQIDPPAKKKASLTDYFNYWKSSPAKYRKLLIGLLFFALFNSSDVFLLLRVKESGWSDSAVIGIYIFYNLVYAIFAYPLGSLADKLGLKKVFILGLMLFAVVYLGMAFANGIIGFLLLFFLYGLYAAATEGISKAWISNISDKGETATAIGTYASFQSICALMASSLAGLIWFQFGATTTFLMTAFAAILVIVYLWRRDL
jgi:MFS family permease